MKKGAEKSIGMQIERRLYIKGLTHVPAPLNGRGGTFKERARGTKRRRRVGRERGQGVRGQLENGEAPLPLIRFATFSLLETDLWNAGLASFRASQKTPLRIKQWGDSNWCYYSGNFFCANKTLMNFVGVVLFWRVIGLGSPLLAISKWVYCIESYFFEKEL